MITRRENCIEDLEPTLIHRNQTTLWSWYVFTRCVMWPFLGTITTDII